MRRIVPILVAALVSAMLAACATSPTGRKQLILLPEDQMTELGIASFREMKKKQPVAEDPRANRYVRCVAEAIVAVLPPRWRRKQWEVVVFKDKTPNAFALPGGKIGVHTGMLKVAANADQLAAVIGHEVGHVLARHGNERLSQNMAAQAGLAVTAALLGGSPEKRQRTLALLGVGTQLGILLPFSRRQESEADEIGLELMAKAGFDPREAVQLWRNMTRASHGGKPPEFLSTHPADATRIRNLQKRMPRALALFRQARAAGRHPDCDRWRPAAVGDDGG